ncbi:MAG: hypothetical protein JOZ78_22460 [Chroococcidiopsidaceae cyanobacterium CP_BM_ER_R8_30]|nr:hypothetical protein [Chroococcidiopsidaceae cyanobacterium CP_BM_ER_R8_30]
MAILSFLGMVNIAIKLVTEKYPDAELYEVDGVSSNGPTTDVLSIDRLRVVFRTRSGGTAIIKSTVWGEFGPVEYADQPWLEDIVIPWPIQMDLAQAAELMTGAGYNTPYKTVTLRWPLYPGVKQPFYIFGLENRIFVFVGVYDKSVTIHS